MPRGRTFTYGIHQIPRSQSEARSDVQLCCVLVILLFCLSNSVLTLILLAPVIAIPYFELFNLFPSLLPSRDFRLAGPPQEYIYSRKASPKRGKPFGLYKESPTDSDSTVANRPGFTDQHVQLYPPTTA